MSTTLLLFTALIGCGDEKIDSAADTDVTLEAASVIGRCDYVNAFSNSGECKAYTGAGWTEEDAAEDCADEPIFGASDGVFLAGADCEYESILGQCLVEGGEDEEYMLTFPGDDAGDCSGVELGCTFAAGEFIPSAICEGGGVGSSDAGGDVFMPFELVCEDEPETADGEVCTWEAISGCTEEGLKYVEYASCEPVFSQRPYVPYDVSPDTPADDARLDDAEWMAEFEWMTAQTEACACVCCHSAEVAPDGPSGWFIEAGPIWLDTVDDDGLAMLAGWVDSTAFGAFPAEDNNGFDRSVTGLPTSDVERMKAFLEGELDRRGFEPDDFSDTPPFGGPLYDQLTYEPESCEEGQGVSPDGTISWTGGGARYLYVMAEDSDNPGVPPNLDLPEGTIWRLDVSPDAAPLDSGVGYGELPEGTSQFAPAEGAPPALVEGETYYLYALADIYQPLTRCLFTF